MLGTEKVRTNVYLNKRTKESAREVLKKYGLNLSDAINLFLSLIAETQTLPFEFRIPNETTRKAIRDVIENRDVEDVTVEELLNEVKKIQAIHQGSEKSPNY